MVPTYTVKGGSHRYRYYVSRPATKGETSKAAISHISAPPLEGLLSGALRRVGLPADEPWSAMHRIDVRANEIVIRLKRAEAMAIWRSAVPDAHSQTDRQILDDRRELLQPGETLTDSGEHLVLSLPIRARFRGGAATMTDPAGKAAPRPDMTLIKAVARAHQWLKMLLSGEATSIEELAKRFGLDRGHVGLTLNLAFLSPTLTCAIVRGEQPPGLRLNRLLRDGVPLSWLEQELAFLPNRAAREKQGMRGAFFPVT